MEEFLDKFAELFDDIDASTLKGETAFRELEDWDSIAALSVIGMIDEEYGITLNAEDMRSSRTLQDLYDKTRK